MEFKYPALNDQLFRNYIISKNISDFKNFSKYLLGKFIK